MVNWKLLEGFDVRNLGFLREPVLWLTAAATVITVVADGLANGWGWRAILIAAVNALFGLVARAQVSPPDPGVSDYGAPARVGDLPGDAAWEHDDSYGPSGG